MKRYCLEEQESRVYNLLINHNLVRLLKGFVLYPRKPMNKIARKVGITYSHASNLIKLLEKEGLIKIDWLDGRSKSVKLTDKGAYLLIKLDEIRRVFEV